LLELLVVGPLLGLLVGWLGIRMLVYVRSSWGVRRDYESLYALGIAVSAFALGEAAGGSGFLSAFFAGLVIAILDVELCDCFHDYGEATAEMLLLLTFVAFGGSLIWTSFQIISLETVAVAAVALLTRTLVLLPALSFTTLPAGEASLLAWMGPRGLSSLLLVMLAVIARVEGAEEMFAVASLAVLASLLLHGGGILWLTQRRLQTATGEPAGAQPNGITIATMNEWRAQGKPYVLLDARAQRSWESDHRTAAGALRLSPDEPVRSARELGLSQHGTLVVYCA
jgi:sodium/hydrogen antiporter